MKPIHFITLLLVCVACVMCFDMSNDRQEAYDLHIPGYNQECSFTEPRCRPKVVYGKKTNDGIYYYAQKVGCVDVKGAAKNDPMHNMCRLVDDVYGVVESGDKADDKWTPKLRASASEVDPFVFLDGTWQGQPCTYNQQCAHGACGRQTEDGDLQCCWDGQDVTTNPFTMKDYYYPVEQNGYCFKDSMCKSPFVCINKQCTTPTPPPQNIHTAYDLGLPGYGGL